MYGHHFHYNENAKMIDAYVNRIEQVAALLNYGEPHILGLSIAEKACNWLIPHNKENTIDSGAI